MTSLKPPWLDEPAVARLLAALAAANIEARFVGGCVRDALLRIGGGDIDLATPAQPVAVMAALKKAKIKAIPTGLAHGTVTAVISPRHFEITTLRRDVETDGRHAKVAFDAGWEDDAARRDFTINAIYLAPDGTIFDPVGGQADLAARRVRFVGDAATRIAEDVLRILRYYRFEARFGSGEGDPAARAACCAAVDKLPTLSAERVWRELSRLLAGPEPVRVLTMMRDDGVLAAILPEATRIDRLRRLLTLSPLNVAADPLLRLEALTEIDPTSAASLGSRLRLSRTEQKRLSEFASLWSDIKPGERIGSMRVKLFLFGGGHTRDVPLVAASERLRAARRARLLALAAEYPPDFPLTGADVMNAGFQEGPRVGQLLEEIKSWWANGKYTADRTACLAKLKELASRS